jgi:hypothetical protein
MAKIAPWCLASRDKLLAKVLGTLRSAQGWPAGLRHQRFLLIPATVVAHARKAAITLKAEIHNTQGILYICKK